MKCKTCGQYMISPETHHCPRAWTVSLHMRDAYRCGFAADERPTQTIYADTAENAAAQYIEWFDREHMSGSLARNDDHLWLYVRPAAVPNAEPLLIRASGCFEPHYDAFASQDKRDVPRCGWYRRCTEPALADDYLCAKHRAEEDATDIRIVNPDTAMIASKPVRVEEDGNILFA